MNKAVLMEKVVKEEGLNAFVESCMNHLNSGSWLLLDGDLGAGKTAFTNTLCKKLGVLLPITSPTFSILNVYETQGNQNSQIQKVLHLDLYRIKKVQELLYLGLEVQWTPNSLVVCEWPFVIENWSLFFETLGFPLPQKTFLLEIERCETTLNGEKLDQEKIEYLSARKYTFSSLESSEWI